MKGDEMIDEAFIDRVNEVFNKYKEDSIVWALKYKEYGIVKHIIDVPVTRGERIKLLQGKLEEESESPKRNALHLAAQVENDMTEVILNSVSDNEERYNLASSGDGSGKTPLHIACRLGNYTAVHAMINAIQNLNQDNWTKLLTVRDNSNSTCLHQVAVGSGSTTYIINDRNSHADVISLLNTSVPSEEWYELMETKSISGLTPLHLAVSEANLEVIMSMRNSVTAMEWYDLLQIKDITELTPIHISLEMNNNSVIDTLTQDMPPGQKYKLLLAQADILDRSIKHKEQLLDRSIKHEEQLLGHEKRLSMRLCSCLKQTRLQDAIDEKDDKERLLKIQRIIMEEPLTYTGVDSLSHISDSFIIPYNQLKMRRHTLIVTTATLTEYLNECIAKTECTNAFVIHLEDVTDLGESIKEYMANIKYNCSLLSVFYIADFPETSNSALVNFLIQQLERYLPKVIPVVIMAQTPNESMLMRLSRCNTVLIRYNCDRVRDFLSFANFLCRADGHADIHTLYCEALTELKAAANGNEELITFQSSLTKYLVLPRSNKHQATVQDNAEHMPAGNPQFLNDCNKMVSSKESLTYDGKEKKPYGLILNNTGDDHTTVELEKSLQRCAGENVFQLRGQSLESLDDEIIEGITKECSLLILVIVDESEAGVEKLLAHVSDLRPSNVPLITVVKLHDSQTPEVDNGPCSNPKVDASTLPDRPNMAHSVIVRSHSVYIRERSTATTNISKFSFIDLMANEFLTADGNKDIYTMFTHVASQLGSMEDSSKRSLEFMSRQQKRLIVPRTDMDHHNLAVHGEKVISSTDIDETLVQAAGTERIEGKENLSAIQGTTITSGFSPGTSSVTNGASLDGFSALFKELSHAANGPKIEHRELNKLVQIKTTQDRIFGSLRRFKLHQMKDSEFATISCILLTSIVEDGDQETMSHLLLLVQGDISVAHHYFNVGKHHCWQIARDKFQSYALESMIKQQYSTLPSVEYLPDAPILIAISIPSRPAEIAVAIPVCNQPTESHREILHAAEGSPLRFVLEESGDDFTSKFQLFLSEKTVDEVRSNFDQYESSSEGSDAYHIAELIDQLDVDQGERCVTILAMAGSDKEGFPHYLLQLIAGHLKEPIFGKADQDQLEIQTHYIGNDTLHDEITKKYKDYLAGLESKDVREKMISNDVPAFVITSTFPSKTYDEKFTIANVMSPEVSKDDDGREVFTFKNSAISELKITLHEPRSPMMGEYQIGTASRSTEIVLDKTNTRDDLDRAHYEMFQNLHSTQDDSATLDDTVSAIISVCRLADGKLNRSVHLLAGAWYGKSFVEIEGAVGLKVTVCPIFNTSLRRMLNSCPTRVNIPWCKTRDAKTAGLTRADMDQDVRGDTVRLEIFQAQKTTKAKIAKHEMEVTFNLATAGELTTDHLEVMRMPIPENYLTAEKYEQNPERQQDRGDDSKRIMINVHSVKTKLDHLSKKLVRGKLVPYVKVKNGDPLSTTVVVLAAGSEDNFALPQSFSYHDPFNSWQCDTVFVNSTEIKSNIENDWRDLMVEFPIDRAGQHPTPIDEPEGRAAVDQEPTVWELIAKHRVLDESCNQICLKLANGKLIKPTRQNKFLEFTSHIRDEKALRNSLEHRQPFLEQCWKWRSSSKSQNLLNEIRDIFFQELPISFKFSTSRFKNMVLPRPHQLGSENKLVLQYHDGAHIKFSQETGEIEVKDEDIRENLEEIKIKRCDMNQNHVGQGASVGEI